MRIKIFNTITDKYDIVPLKPMFEEYIVVIDPSKSNMAIIIATPTGELESIVELTGNNWKDYSFKIDDDTDYCESVRQFLDFYTQDLNITRVYVEKAITKKGMMHHHSNMTLTEIRATILSWGLQKTGKKPVEIPNVSWKHEVFPEGCNRQSEKMSKWYLVEFLGMTDFQDYFEFDVTDAYCMLLYVVGKYYPNYEVMPFVKEEANGEYNYKIVPWDGKMPTLKINSDFTLKENVAFFNNRMMSGIFIFDVKRLSCDDIYSHAVGFDEHYSMSIVQVEVLCNV